MKRTWLMIKKIETQYYIRPASNWDDRYYKDVILKIKSYHHVIYVEFKLRYLYFHSYSYSYIYIYLYNTDSKRKLRRRSRTKPVVVREKHLSYEGRE